MTACLLTCRARDVFSPSMKSSTPKMLVHTNATGIGAIGLPVPACVLDVARYPLAVLTCLELTTTRIKEGILYLTLYKE